MARTVKLPEVATVRFPAGSLATIERALGDGERQADLIRQAALKEAQRRLATHSKATAA
jgi:hypothetical protein